MSDADEFIVFGAPDIREEEIQEVVDTLKSGWLGTGPKVTDFEHKFADYKGVSATNTLALNSCSSALHLALVVAGIKHGDEVITTATTFCATINAIIHAGATPVLIDIDPLTLNIDVNKIEDAITKKTKVILPVHLAGLPCDMDSIIAISHKYNLVVIEDCAHAVESIYKGKKIGTIGDYGCFSFYSTKNIVTAEGGMLVAKDESKISTSRKLAMQGMDHDAWNRFGKSGYKHYSIYQAGYKYNMTDINASLGIHQLARVEQSWVQRKRIWDYYSETLSGLPATLPYMPDKDVKHGCHLYAFQIDEKQSKNDRDSFINIMKNFKIGTGVHYKSIAEYSYYIDLLNLDLKNYPVSLRNGRCTVSIPLSGNLDHAQVERITESVKYALV